MRAMKGILWNKFETGQTGPEALKLLDEATNVSIENTQEPLNIWQNIYINFTGLKGIRFYFKIKDFICCGGLAKNYITRHLAFIYETTTTFITAAQETKAFQAEFPMK
jgi:hypothetical protein